MFSIFFFSEIWTAWSLDWKSLRSFFSLKLESPKNLISIDLSQKRQFWLCAHIPELHSEFVHVAVSILSDNAVHVHETHTCVWPVVRAYKRKAYTALYYAQCNNVGFRVYTTLCMCAHWERNYIRAYARNTYIYARTPTYTLRLHIRRFSRI